MKKIITLLLFTVALTFVSCEDEPLEGDFETGGTTCEVAIANTAQAALNFLGVNDDNYTQLCSAYSTALQAQITACGDPDGSLQLALNALGDCTITGVDNCEDATLAVMSAQSAYENANDEDYLNLCNVYKTTLENQIVQCGDEDGSIQSIIDGLGDCVLETQASIWELIQGDPTSTTSKLDAIHFKNSLEGFVGGGSLSMKATTDGGNTWESVSGYNGIRDFSFSSENNGWSAGISGQSMRYTTDGGQSWTDITPINSNSLWGVAVDNTNDYAYFVGTGGIIWKYYNSVGLLDDISITGETGLVTDVYVTTDGVLLAILQEDGRILLSDNGGISWAEVSNFDGGSYTEMTFPSASIGYAAGSSGAVAKTTDGGFTWESLTTGSNGYFQGIHFYDENHGIVVGAIGRVYYTNDGGASWSSQDIGNTVNVYDVRLLSPTSAIIIGDGQTIMKCDNIIF
ncbi:WD40/YVTN/BNR-like repeat-containing protein [Psychroserpens damuponensis]|uniref:WD40/YVTN/BNR-like repeat-containing protein n=1 Tax=Psychroserpens damuponensis TaxID=943936 RepID=UPI000591330B|nr:YCF48-related protein [Psychroserpens damuponensis]